MAYQGIVFDLDGTLLNTLEDLYLATNHALTSLGFPVRTRDEVRSFVGNGYRRLFALACPADSSDEQQEQALAAFNAYYLAHDQDHTAPYPGIGQLLATLRARGAKLAVVSNKGDEAVQDLMQHYFPGTFDAVAGEKANVRRKPAPDTVCAVMRDMGVSAKDIVYVGDSEVDVATAANVSCDAIIVTWGFRDRGYLASVGAKTFADTTEELLELLMN